MNKKVAKYLLSFVFLALLALPVITFAQSDPFGLDPVREGLSDSPLQETDPRTTVARLITTAMILLGTIAVAIVLAAGFKWMTAGGNEDKIDDAKKLMTSGVVGLIIILSAWGIATFIINQLQSATGGA